MLLKHLAPVSLNKLILRFSVTGCGARGAALKLPAWALTAMVLLVTAVSGALADDDDEGSPEDCPIRCVPCERKADEVWAIDDRHVACCTKEADVIAALRFQRYDAAACQWRSAKADEFFDGPGSGLPTCYWVHGDRIDPSEALDIGLTVYHRLMEGTCDAPPQRFVVWSWPTSQVYRRPVPDVRLKASRAPASAFHLACVLSRDKGKAPVGLIGYSYGSRVITGALTVLSGGELDGLKLENPAAPVARFRAALMVSATDHDWLEPDQPHGSALKSVEKMLLINNACDRILARYRLLACGRHGPPALGYCGVASMSALGPDAAKIRQYDACCEIGKYHRWRLYIGSDSIMGQIRATVLP